MSKKILYLAYGGMTDHLGQSQVLPYLTSLSNRYGYRFTIISFEKLDKYKALRPTIEAICREAKIKWLPQMYTKKPPVLSTMKDLFQLRRLAFDLCRQEKFSIVHCRSYPVSIIGLQLQKKFGLKYIFDMRGFYADERVDGGIWNLKNPVHKLVYRYFKSKEIEFLEKADFVVTLTKAAKEEISRWDLSSPPNQIQVIPCCADFQLFDYEKITDKSKLELRSQLQISNDSFVLSYLGSIGTWYMLDEMLAFFKRLLIRKPNSVFLFITGDPTETIESAAKNNSIPRERLVITQAPRSLVPIHLSISQLNIFFILPVFSKKASSPTKQAEVMGMGIPIICNDNVGDTGRIMKRINEEWVISTFQDSSYDQAIEAIISPKQHVSSPSIRKTGLDYYDLNSGVKKYHNIYQQLTK